MRIARAVACLGFALSVGCQDTPTATELTRAGLPGESSSAKRSLPDPLCLVAQLPTDALLRPLFLRVLGKEGLERLAAKLTPLAKEPTEKQLLDAASALKRMQEHPAKRAPGDASVVLSVTSEMDDPEAAIIDDVVQLVVDDALLTLLTATDSTGTDTTEATS